MITIYDIEKMSRIELFNHIKSSILNGKGMGIVNLTDKFGRMKKQIKHSDLTAQLLQIFNSTPMQNLSKVLDKFEKEKL